MDANPTQSDNTGSASRKVRVGLGARRYDIVIGPALLTCAGALIQEHAPARKCAIVSDETVAGLHLERLMDGLDGHIDVAGTVIVPPGEASKDFTQLERVCGDLLDLGVERDDLVIAFGGGVIGDLAGFAAAILRRGVRFIQIPTTLLAQVDSSVGGKTGINTAHGKNLIGSFHQPSLVRSGYAEVVKYGLLGDADFFSWLDINREEIFSQSDALIQAVETSCKAKAQIVEEDELEMGRRALLNLGHTFGHALEAYAGYSDRLLHGEGVSIGMALAFEFSSELGLCPSQECERAITHLRAAGLPVRIKDIPGGTPETGELIKLIGQDKKVQGGVPVFILTRGVGDAFIERGVKRSKLEDFLTRKCRET